ncbi:MAG: DUF2610 domain-containing protein [Rickettsiaceae bacterium]|nr:DUF2610 domain-containing protein [Rickettsiaceae bacterium]
MKKFIVTCDFGGQKAPFAFYIGNPEASRHPILNQADWLSKNRGGSVPPAFMETISKLKTLAEKNNVSLEELCVYALGSAQQAANEDARAKSRGGGVSEAQNPDEVETNPGDNLSAQNPNLDEDDNELDLVSDLDPDELKFLKSIEENIENRKEQDAQKEQNSEAEQNPEDNKS